MQIVADRDILAIDEKFSRFGELIKVPGREISSSHLRQCDVLLVRSVTSVDESLLQNTPVSFVGTATSGIDHVDVGYLQKNGITFCHAAGCNANAVVEYCLTAIAHVSSARIKSFSSLNVAIIGAGHVGGLFARRLTKLGASCLVVDPLLDKSKILALESAGCEMTSLERALGADIVSVHVPLTFDGPCRTFHLFGEDEFESLANGGILINTARGSVLDNKALLATLIRRPDLRIILDVWESEPDIDEELLARVQLATPHIAGYSMEAKHNATVMLERELSNYLKLDHSVDDEISRLSATTVSMVEYPNRATAMQKLAAILGSVCTLPDLDREFRAQNPRSMNNKVTVFDTLRKQQAGRREFTHYQLDKSKVDQELLDQLTALGFNPT